MGQWADVGLPLFQVVGMSLGLPPALKTMRLTEDLSINCIAAFRKQRGQQGGNGQILTHARR